jgi:hypothetical protein
MARHPENAGLRLELEAIQCEIASLRSQLGIAEGIPQRRSPSAGAAVAVVAAAAAAERSTSTSTEAGADAGAGLKRSFSVATYDKMLSNPKLDAAQREKIMAMKERRAAKEAALESSMTELVRNASSATQAALREAMAGLEEARRAAGFGAPPAAAKAAPAPAAGESVTALVRTASAATQAALRQSMEELAEYKRSQGLAWGAPEPEPEQAANQQSVASLMRTASPAAHAALQQSMRELAEAKRAFPHQSSSPRPLPLEPDDGDSLKRQFSTEMYDRMLENPNLSAEQREKLEVMRMRRQAKEDASTTTMTVRAYAALHTCMQTSCSAPDRDARYSKGCSCVNVPSLGAGTCPAGLPRCTGRLAAIHERPWGRKACRGRRQRLQWVRHATHSQCSVT